MKTESKKMSKNMDRKAVQTKGIAAKALKSVKGSKTGSKLAKVSLPVAAGGLLVAGVAGVLIWKNREAISSTLSEFGIKLPKFFSEKSKYSEMDADIGSTTSAYGSSDHESTPASQYL